MAAAVSSSVETATLAHSDDKKFFDDELVKTIVVNNFPLLGKLTAFRFIEWAQQNRGGVVSLPTGKTPEFFIKWVRRVLDEWDTPAVQAELVSYGLAHGAADKPDMASLSFVQIDEFFPIGAAQHNSFHSYITKFYLQGLGFDPAKALLINADEICDVSVWPDLSVDLSLRVRLPANATEERQKAELARVDQWCQDYEAKIRAKGGIGFFLGGIGPDGHIAFNCSGSDHFSTTRLTAVNYATQAAAAGDLGGIEVSSKRLVITIGLGTISFKPDATAIIIAAGEAKAQIVADSLIKRASVHFPASVLHGMVNARFFITRGAAKLLPLRSLAELERQPLSESIIDRVLVDICVADRVRLVDLTNELVRRHAAGALLLAKLPADTDCGALGANAAQRIVTKIENGCHSYSNTRFLHTEPHHDDIMLGYMAQVVRQTRKDTNTHFFACLTSGFNSVTNDFIVQRLDDLAVFLSSAEFAKLCEEGDYFDPANQRGAARDVWQYLDGLAMRSTAMCADGTSRRLVRNLIAIFGDVPTVPSLTARISALKAYLANMYAGQRTGSQVETLKGACREFEADTLWGFLGWECQDIWHGRLNFYTADIFNEEPDLERDVTPVLRYLERVRPDIVSVALDPEASGPDTHYKVLQAVTAAVKLYADRPETSHVRVWGYRNVWFRFHAADVNQIIPVSLMQFGVLRDSFMSTFNSQKDASFPSYAYNGPFCDIAQQVQHDQFDIIKTCLGREWFHNHTSPLIRATHGLIFLKDMSLPEFYEQSRALKSAFAANSASAH